MWGSEVPQSCFCMHYYDHLFIGAQRNCQSFPPTPLALPHPKKLMLERTERVWELGLFLMIAQQGLFFSHKTKVHKRNFAESLFISGSPFSLEVVKTNLCKSKQPPYFRSMTEFTVHFALLPFPPLPSSPSPFTYLFFLLKIGAHVFQSSLRLFVS